MDKKNSRVYSDVFMKLANQLDLTSTRSERVYKTIIESVTRTLDVEEASIWRFAQTNKKVHCLAVQGTAETRKPRGGIDLAFHTPYLMSLQMDPFIAVPDTIQDRRFVALPSDYWILTDVKSSLHVPVRTANKVHGILRMDSSTPRDWTEEEIRFCCQVANMILQVFSSRERVTANRQANALRSMRINPDTRPRTDIIKRLTSVISSLNRPVPLERIIPMIGQGALRLSNAEKLALVLREPDGIVRASWVFGLVKPEIARVIEKDGSRLLETFGNMEPVWLSKVADSQLPPSLKINLSFEGVNSARITPMVHSGNVIGLIAALDEAPIEWTQGEMEIMETYATAAALALQSISLYDQLERGYLDLALSLMNSVDAREGKTNTASMQLADWCQETARLLGLPREEQNLVRWAALLHDIGKADIPDEVLRKPGPLSAAERKVIEQYPLKSEEMLRPSSRFQGVGKVLRCIHERFDGNGYPDRKKGEDIPLPARILAVANAYGSMIDNRPYRQAYSHQEAVQEIMRNSGTQFDPVVVNAFLQTVSRPEMIHYR
jgi:GAF domain-containing protein